MAEESSSGQLNKISLMVNDKKKYLNVLFQIYLEVNRIRQN